MKIVTPKQMHSIEQEAYQNGASEEDFMEEAGSGVALIAHDYAEAYHIDRNIVLLCGKGNNAGDAYVAGIHLLKLDYKVVALQLWPLEECTPLCRKHHQQFTIDGGLVKDVRHLEDLILPHYGLVIDGLFGTGFKGQVKEPISSIIRLINQSKLPIISVDIPSGLNGEDGTVGSEAIMATETAFLGLPKKGFFLNEGWNFIGKLRYVDFGLEHHYIEDLDSKFLMLTSDTVKQWLPVIQRNRHKYHRGHVIGLAGSPSMPGAALLSSYAALNGGAGIVHLMHPPGMEMLLACSPYEIIKVPFEYGKTDDLIASLNKASAVYMGPGLGRSKETQELLKKILPLLKKPCVLDADALFMLSENAIALPEQTILTPHHGEMQRLLGHKSPENLDEQFLDQCQAYCEKMQVTLVLKGAPTFILSPFEPILVNPTGDPGMATAGSGDVLTGLIAALASQNVHPRKAAALGVYLHGLAGEYGSEIKTSHCLIASDLIENLSIAFAELLLPMI